jgi:hypothetical protein
MVWTKGKYRVVEENHEGVDGYTVYGPGNTWSWYSKILAKTEEGALSLRIASVKIQQKWRVERLLGDILQYGWSTLWRTVAFWGFLKISLLSWGSQMYLSSYSYELHDVLELILWLIALTLALLLLDSTLILEPENYYNFSHKIQDIDLKSSIGSDKMKGNRIRSFHGAQVFIFSAGSFVIWNVNYAADSVLRSSYASESYRANLRIEHFAFYFGIGLLLLIGWYHWKRHIKAVD